MNLSKFNKEVDEFMSYVDHLEEGSSDVYDNLNSLALKMSKLIFKVKSMSRKKGIINSDVNRNNDALLSSINHFRRENAYYELLSFSEAVKELKRVIAESTDGHVIASAYNGLGHIYAVRQYYDEALYNFQKVVEFYPGYIDGHFNLGAIYYNLKMYNEAIIEFNKVINLDHSDREAFLCLSYAYQKMSNPEMSEYYLRRYKDSEENTFSQIN